MFENIILEDLQKYFKCKIVVQKNKYWIFSEVGSM